MRIHEVFPYLCVSNATEALEFYTKAFGATEKFRLTEPSGRIGHAECDDYRAADERADERDARPRL